MVPWPGNPAQEQAAFGLVGDCSIRIAKAYWKAIRFGWRLAMHGAIYLNLQKFARKLGGDSLWPSLLDEAGLVPQVFSPARVYPDGAIISLIGAASRHLNLSPDEVVREFGRFLGPELLKMHGRLLQQEWGALEVIENTEAIMHKAVRVGNPDASPPQLEVFRSGPDDLQIIYTSERRMCHLAMGIIAGIAGHFGETIETEEDACMHKGDPFCSILLRRTSKRIPSIVGTNSSMETSVLAEADPNKMLGSDESEVTNSLLRLMNPPFRQGELGRIGHYRILGIMDRGAMGIVLKAEDARLGRIVAFKILRPDLLGDTRMVQRFLREARSLACVKSDHVVAVYDVDSHKGIPFLAMECLNGRSLEEYVVKESIRNPVAIEVAWIGRDVARGLAAVHSKGLIHRDIKPSNLWVDYDQKRVKILDFGLARNTEVASALSQPGVLIGTPAFMSPEQAKGHPISFKSDLFSLGSVLFWLATARLPFPGTDLLSTLCSLASQTPPSAQTINSSIPSDLSGLIEHLLQKNLDDRPESAEAISLLLHDILVREQAIGISL